MNLPAPPAQGSHRPDAPPAARRRLMLVDDHAILRTGLRMLVDLEPDLQVAGEAGSADEALGCLAECAPELVLCDLALPGRSGLELVRELRERDPHLRLLVLSAHGDDEYVRAALAGGALGYVLKDSAREELLQGIRTVLRGEWFLCQALSSRVLTGLLSGPAPREARLEREPVTRREREVLTRIATGLTNREIAGQLGLSVKTVRKHRQNLMLKLALHNAAAVTAYAIHNGYITRQPAA